MRQLPSSNSQLPKTTAHRAPRTAHRAPPRCLYRAPLSAPRSVRQLSAQSCPACFVLTKARERFSAKPWAGYRLRLRLQRPASRGALRCSRPWPRRGTRYANCVRCARTTATSMSTMRASRAGHGLCAPQRCIGAATGSPPTAFGPAVVFAARCSIDLLSGKRQPALCSAVQRWRRYRRCQPRMAGG
jgi:hypothetical protein